MQRAESSDARAKENEVLPAHGGYLAYGRVAEMAYPLGMMPLPKLIQGGMGVGVSNWRLARAVAAAGHLGVVSSTGLDTLMVRRLQDGDPEGHVRAAIAQFPWRDVAERVLAKWFRPGGRAAGQKYRLLPLFSCREDRERDATTVLANFVEVWLARQGHRGEVGINLLTKIQPPTLPALYGAMLAGASWVLMGAGIPRDIPGALDQLAGHGVATMRYEVAGATAPVDLSFDPGAHAPRPAEPLARPRFLPIVASHSLATMLLRKANGRVDGFVVEGPTAGGHNAPPRGDGGRNDRGEPVYGPRDAVDHAAMRDLGVPFWLAGGVGSPHGVAAAFAAGAAGVQVGTLFAFCAESGLTDQLKAAVLAAARADQIDVRTDPRASPTGYPFKVVSAPGLPESTSDRARVCDLGYLRQAYLRPDGSIGHRCSGEPVEAFVKKGGAVADTVGRRCLCNGLMADIGFPQPRGEGAEMPLVTAGDDLRAIGAFLAGRASYRAQDVVDHLLGAPQPV
jgi:NAD(P)H-dependent flavin oxidoreductase YrpB (nitropropane dioxygenase family)